MLECVGDTFVLLVTDLSDLLINISYLSTLASGSWI